MTNKQGLQTYKDLLRTVSKHISGMFKERQTVQQVVATKPTQAFNSQFKGTVVTADTFTTIVYKSLLGLRR